MNSRMKLCKRLSTNPWRVKQGVGGLKASLEFRGQAVSRNRQALENGCSDWLTFRAWEFMCRHCLGDNNPLSAVLSLGKRTLSRWYFVQRKFPPKTVPTLLANQSRDTALAGLSTLISTFETARCNPGKSKPPAAHFGSQRTKEDVPTFNFGRNIIFGVAALFWEAPGIAELGCCRQRLLMRLGGQGKTNL